MMKRKLRFLWIACSVLMFGGVAASAQSVAVNGRVTNVAGEPLIGVFIQAQGTQVAAISDTSGAYSIQAPSASSVLVYSYVGYVSQEVTVGTQRTINITLEEDVQTLGDVVVVGYGTRRAGEVTGSISTVNAEEIEKLAAVDTGELLRNVPGVTVLQSNTPGAEPAIRIRGVGTIQDSAPLWVVDGVPGAPVNPNNVENISVLKDAAAAAIYGARAANGVILVTTKAGRKNQKATVRLNLRTGITKLGKYYDLLDTEEYAEQLWMVYENDFRLGGAKTVLHPLYGEFRAGEGTTPRIPDWLLPNGIMDGQLDDNGKLIADPANYSDAFPNDNLMTKTNKEGTDWWKVMTRTGKYTDLSMNVSGGSENTTYSFQMGYMNQQTPMKFTGFNRFNLQSNITSDLTKWLRVGQNLMVTYDLRQGDNTNNGESSIVSWGYRSQPIIPVYDIMGNFAGSHVGGQLGNSQNPLFLLTHNQYDTTRNMRVAGNVNLTATPIEGLTYRTMLGFTHTGMSNKNLNYLEIAYSERGNADSVSRREDIRRNWNWSNTIDYTRTFGDHNFTVLLGTEAVSEDFSRVDAGRQMYTLKSPNYMDLRTGETVQTNNSETWERTMFSIFGRINYSFKNRYLLEAVVRRDGSSRFGAGNKYGTFPAASLAWRLSEESFMESTRGWLNEAKVRVGVGVAGNDRIDNYNAYTTFNLDMGGQGSFYNFSGTNGSLGSTGFREARKGNSDSKWESTMTTNFGLDLTLFRNFDITFDLWQRRTTDMLYRKALPAVQGRAEAPFINVGEMLNRGFDIDVTYRNSAAGGDFQYMINANISRYKNELVRLSGTEGEFLEGSGQREMVYTRSQTGTAFPEFFGYIVDGIFQTQAEADAWAVYEGAADHNKPGRFKFRDIDGDQKITPADRTYIGSPHPKFTGGLMANLTYKNVDLNIEFYGVYGNKLTNYVARWIDYNQFNGGRSHNRLYHSWGSPYLNGDNSKAILPIAETNDKIDQSPSTAFLEDASYLRLRNLMIGYNFTSLLNMPSGMSLRLYAQGTNLFTLTKYSGLDPEVNAGAGAGNGRDLGVDMGAWPTPRQFMIGVTLGF